MRAGGGAMRPEREGGQESACCSKTAVLFTFALFLIDFFFWDSDNLVGNSNNVKISRYFTASYLHRELHRIKCSEPEFLPTAQGYFKGFRPR